MPSRIYWMPAVVLWFAAMGWLISTKILPTLTGGQAPGYAELLPKTEVTEPEPVRWIIRWNGAEIGQAENKISRNMDGTGCIVSEVQFQQLPVEKMLADLMGVFGRFAQPMFKGIGKLDLQVSTKLNFNHYGELSDIESSLDVGEDEDLMLVQGKIKEDTLKLKASINIGDGESTDVREKEFRLPPDALVTDSFSPRPRMSNLRVGQTWTLQSYQPLMPQSLVLIEATVEREELVEWDGRMVETRMVAFRRDSGSGISSTRTPTSMMWVMRDGTVIRQDMMLASVKVQFIREPPSSQDRSASSDSEELSVEEQ